MAQTDSKDGSLGGLNCRSEMFNCRCKCRWIARTIGNEETVVGFWIWEGRIPGEDLELDSSFGETTDLVELQTNIENDDP
jgi:hypothetical protein